MINDGVKGIKERRSGAQLSHLHIGSLSVSIATLGFCLYLYLSFIGILPFQPRSSLLFTNTVDGSLARQILLFSTVGMILQASMFNSRNRAGFLPWPLVFLLLWCGVTLLWSPAPELSSRRLIYTVLSVAVVFSYTRCVGPAHMMKTLAFFLALLIVGSLLAGAFVPAAVHQPSDPESPTVGLWRGLFYHKNDAGLVGAFSAIIFFFEYLKSRRLVSACLFAFSLLLLFLSFAKTSLVLLPLSCLTGALVYGLGIRVLNRTILLVATAGCLLAVGLSLLIEWESIEQLLLDNPRAFTGRAAIWSALWAVAQDGAWLHGTGYGSLFGVGDKTPLAPYLIDWTQEAGHGHNAYLELLVSIGLPGLIVAILALVVQPLWLFLDRRRIAGYQAMQQISLLAFLALHNLLETSLLDRGRIGWVLLLCVASVAYFSGSTMRMGSGNPENIGGPRAQALHRKSSLQEWRS